jgi:hypothetical protein
VRFVVLTACSSIVSSRKRKLRELFAVATIEDGIPNFDFSDPDAPSTTPDEETFLNESDILRYVSRPFFDVCMLSNLFEREILAPSRLYGF